MPREAWDGPDSTRPLLLRGTTQSTSIAPGIAAYRPEKILTSDAVRCVSTITPLAELTELTPKLVAGISQDAYEDGEATIGALLEKRMKSKMTVVLCSHGPVIPDIISEIAILTRTPMSTEFGSVGALSTGEFSVLHISAQHPKSGIVALETHSPEPE